LGGLAGEATVGESKFLPEALMRNDPDAKLILGELAGDLAFGLSHVVQLIHPAVLVLGGGLAHLGEPLRSAVAEELPETCDGSILPAASVATGRAWGGCRAGRCAIAGLDVVVNDSGLGFYPKCGRIDCEQTGRWSGPAMKGLR